MNKNYYYLLKTLILFKLLQYDNIINMLIISRYYLYLLNS